MSSRGKQKQKTLQVMCTLTALELGSSHLFFSPHSVIHPGLLDSLMIYRRVL